jgi:hypothetical protein
MTYPGNAILATESAPKAMEHEPKGAPPQHHDDAGDRCHDRSEREKRFRCEISEKQSRIRHGNGLSRKGVRRWKNEGKGSSSFTMLEARTAPGEVPRVLKAGYNRWTAMSASVVATDDETSAFEIGMTRKGDLSR